MSFLTLEEKAVGFIQKRFFLIGAKRLNMTTNTCSSCKKLFEAKDIRNNLCKECLAVEVVKHWLKSDQAN